MLDTTKNAELRSTLKEILIPLRQGRSLSPEECLALSGLLEKRFSDIEKSSLWAELVEEASEAVCLFDEHGHFLYVNSVFEALTGFRREELLGRSLAFMHSHSENRDLHLEKWCLLPEGDVWRGRIPGKKKNGAPYEAYSTIFPIRDEAGHLRNFVSFSHCVSNRPHDEGELQDAQKLQALGALAGVMSHDFNNILMAQMGYLDMAISTVSPDSKTAKYLEKIMRASRRAKAIVGQIKAFSRGGEEKLQALQLADIAGEALSLLNATLPCEIKIKASLPPCPLVAADAGQLYQVFMNLFMNAVQSMEPVRGVLEVSLSVRTIPPEGVHGALLGALPGEYVCVSVKDNGTGIPEALIARIFEPFFATKEIGSGGGLGLAVVHGIVAGIGGEIVVESVSGKGSSFHVYLPVAKDDDAPQAESIQERQENKKSPLPPPKVLLIDDDEMLLEVGKYMLESLGCEPVLARNGEESLSLLSASPGSFSLILLDHNLPDTKGISLASKLAALQDKVPIVLCTGNGIYSERQLPECIREVVGKPIDLDRLEEIVNLYVPFPDSGDRSPP